MQPGWFWGNQRETTSHYCSSISTGYPLLHELMTKLQHSIIVTLTAHNHRTFFQLWSFISPLAHWDQVMKSCLKVLGKISRRLDIVLSAIKSLQSGTLFHLQSVGRLLLLPSNPHFIFPLTARVVGGTTDDFATSFLHFPLFSTALWDFANSSPVHSLTLSSHFLSCLPCLLPPFHCALRDGFGQTWWIGDMTIPLQFASLYHGQEVFVWSDCLLDLGTDFIVGNMFFVWDT